MQDNREPYQDELTLRELILAIQDYRRYFLRKWYWFVIGGLALGGLLFYVAITGEVTYVAPITFVMEGEKKPATGGDLLSTLGLGGGSGNNAMKLIEMAQSRQIVSKVLFDSAVVNGKNQFIADHLIEVYDYHADWEESLELNNFRFDGNVPDKNDFTGNRALKSVYGKLMRGDEPLCTANYDELSGVFTLSCNTLAPELSIAITESLYEKLVSYYVESTIASRQKTYDQLKYRADSVRIALVNADAKSARFRDKGNLILNTSSSQGLQLNREVMMLSAMYAEIVKNKESTAFILANSTPAFSLIDVPLMPLSVNETSWKNYLVIGVFLGAILVGVLLFFKKLVNDAMVNE